MQAFQRLRSLSARWAADNFDKLVEPDSISRVPDMARKPSIGSAEPTAISVGVPDEVLFVELVP
jgi:hypothetical protein